MPHLAVKQEAPRNCGIQHNRNIMPKLAATLLSLIPTLTLSAQAAFHTSPACWTEPRIHSEMRENDVVLTIQHIDGNMPHESVPSPNHVYSFFLKEEAIPKNGMSRVEITIYNERPYLLHITLPSVRGIGQPQWINEQLFSVRVWWGRIAGTDYIIDVEREEVVNQQAFRYGAIAFQQFKQCATPVWSESAACKCYPEAPKGWKP